ncbi:MAG: DUF86 domain-containing protein [Verrucomicrobia bacterium]|nr:DUF86 domain-containing protein [Verrucomicrobiota bacterium]
MDLELVRSKQDSIVRSLGRIQSKRDLTVKALLEDYDAQDVIVLNLERAVQQAVDIAMHLLADTTEPAPESMRDAFDALRRIGALTPYTAERMSKAVGFRNTAVHAYQELDWAIVQSIVSTRLSDFRDFIKEIDVFLKRSSPSP